MSRIVSRALAATACAALVATTSALAPWPHLALARSEPAANAHLDAQPAAVTLWFTERPELALSRIRLAGPAGDIALGRIAADSGDALRVAVAAPVPDGAYVIHWQTSSADGHVISGTIPFTVGAVAAGTAEMPSDTATAEGHRPSVAERIVRGGEFAGLLTVLGMLAFLYGVLPPLAARGVRTADASSQARGIGEIAAVVYLLAATYRVVVALGAAGMGLMDAASAPTLADIVLRSSWGNGWLVGLLGAVLVLPGFVLSRRQIAVGTPITLTGAFAMAISPALSGHAAAGSPFVASVTFDALHVVTVGAWVGGLSAVLAVGIPAMRRVTDGNPDAAVSALVNSFHPIALFCAPLAVLSGVGSAVLRLGSVDALRATPYGATLLWKTGLVLLVLAMGAWNSSRARRRLGTPQATAQLRRSAAVELAFAVLVLVVTMQLVTLPVPSAMAP